MSALIYTFNIYDGRYLTDEHSAICLETCDTIEEAREQKAEYGTDTVIVKETLKRISDKAYRVVTSEVVE